MTITFSYKKMDRPAPYPTEYTPSIPVTLSGPDGSIDVIGLLDSGADYSLIPLDIAKILGLDLKNKAESIGGIGGDLNAIRTKMTLSINKGHERYRFHVGVYVVCGEFKDDFPILIGREDFFNKFKITFEERSKKVKLKRDSNRR